MCHVKNIMTKFSLKIHWLSHKKYDSSILGHKNSLIKNIVIIYLESVFLEKPRRSK